MEKKISEEYEAFLKTNRIKVNKYMNRVLWIFIFAGPAIALARKAGLFLEIKYITCLIISVGMAILAAIHLFLCKKFPGKAIAFIFALTTYDVLLLYMTCHNVGIYICWFVVPLLSLLFCEKYMYFYASGLNYILLVISTWYNSFYFANVRSDYDTPLAYFIDKVSGFTIELIIMFISGFIIGKLTLEYFKNLHSQKIVIKEQKKSMNEKMGILDSMAEIYDHVNLIDFVNNTEMSLRDPSQTKHVIDLNNQTQTLMNQKIDDKILPEQLQDFMEFTNIKTVRSRLANKKVISAEFIDVESGWFRAQYITVDSGMDGIPNLVIYTIRNVDEDKRREENLIKISMTDEMTRLYNRRSYDEDLKNFRKDGLDPNFVLFSIDINGLKRANDTNGHAAGDELIKAAAACLSKTTGNKGKAYRTGGDEFMIITCIDNPEDLKIAIKEKTKNWKGIYTQNLALSVGYASYKENPAASIDDLEHIADSQMYKDKEKFYRESGIDRRRR